MTEGQGAGVCVGGEGGGRGGQMADAEETSRLPLPHPPSSSLAVRRRCWFLQATFIPFPITMKTTKTRYPPNTPLHVSARNIGEEEEEVEKK